MKNDIFYDTVSADVTVRESFNNTILLLSMIRSEYYYITGFSRPLNTVTAGFDFKSGLHDSLTETIKIKFDGKSRKVIFLSELKNIRADETSLTLIKNKNFRVNGSRIIYRRTVETDRLFPVTVSEMNSHIMSAKNEIICLTETYYHILTAR